MFCVLFRSFALGVTRHLRLSRGHHFDFSSRNFLETPPPLPDTFTAHCKWFSIPTSRLCPCEVIFCLTSTTFTFYVIYLLEIYPNCRLTCSVSLPSQLNF